MISQSWNTRTSGEPSCQTVQDSPRTAIGEFERTECWNNTETSSRTAIGELEHTECWNNTETSSRTAIGELERKEWWNNTETSSRTAIGELERTECWNAYFRRHRNFIKDRYRTVGTAAPGRSDDSSSRTDIRLLKQLLHSAQTRTAIGELEHTECWNTDTRQYRAIQGPLSERWNTRSVGTMISDDTESPSRTDIVELEHTDLWRTLVQDST